MHKSRKTGTALKIGWRILEFLLILLILSIVVFVLARLAPGDPLQSFYGDAVESMTTEELAKEQLKKKYAVQLIAEEEKLNLTQEEYEYRLAKRAEENRIADAQAYESMFGYDKLSEIFLEERVMEFLIDNLEGLRRTPN